MLRIGISRTGHLNTKNVRLPSTRGYNSRLTTIDKQMPISHVRQVIKARLNLDIASSNTADTIS